MRESLCLSTTDRAQNKQHLISWQPLIRIRCRLRGFTLAWPFHSYDCRIYNMSFFSFRDNECYHCLSFQNPHSNVLQIREGRLMGKNYCSGSVTGRRNGVQGAMCLYLNENTRVS